MKEVPAHEILEKLFQTIVKEAESNTKFAEEMLGAFSENLAINADQNTTDENSVAKNTPSQEGKEEHAPSKKKSVRTKQPSKDSFDVKAYNPVIMFRKTGEDLMRVKLNKLTATNLKKIAKHFQLKLSTLTKSKSPTKPELITAIITFAKNYDAQRKGAVG